jgi:hypothetical protein
MINALPLLLLAAASPIAGRAELTNQEAKTVSAKRTANVQVQAQATIISATIVRAKPPQHSERETDREYYRRKSGLMVEFY